jgi:hypothetical protein
LKKAKISKKSAKMKKIWKMKKKLKNSKQKKYFHKKMISTVHSVAEAGLKRSPFS